MDTAPAIELLPRVDGVPVGFDHNELRAQLDRGTDIAYLRARHRGVNAGDNEATMAVRVDGKRYEGAWIFKATRDCDGEVEDIFLSVPDNTDEHPTRTLYLHIRTNGMSPLGIIITQAYVFTDDDSATPSVWLVAASFGLLSK